MGGGGRRGKGWGEYVRGSTDLTQNYGGISRSSHSDLDEIEREQKCIHPIETVDFFIAFLESPSPIALGFFISYSTGFLSSTCGSLTFVLYSKLGDSAFHVLF